MRKAIILGVLVLAMAPPRLVQAQFLGIGNATEWTQILNNIQLIQSYYKQAQAALTQLQQYNRMVLEGKNLAQHPLTNIQSDLARLFQINRNMGGLAFGAANLDQQFRSVYGTYAQSQQPYYPTYLNWYKTTMDTLGNTVARVGISTSTLQNEQAVMQRIRAMLQTPAGRNESIQLGTVIGAETLSAIQKLQATLSDDMATKAAVAAYQINKDQAAAAAADTALTHVDRGANPKGY